jgi:hypothetical protein
VLRAEGFRFVSRFAARDREELGGGGDRVHDADVDAIGAKLGAKTLGQADLRELDGRIRTHVRDPRVPTTDDMTMTCPDRCCLNIGSAARAAWYVPL